VSPVSGGVCQKVSGEGDCDFPTDTTNFRQDFDGQSCRFLTENIKRVHNFNYASKFSQNAEFLASNFSLLAKNFPIRIRFPQQFSNNPKWRGRNGAAPVAPPLCQNAAVPLTPRTQIQQCYSLPGKRGRWRRVGGSWTDRGVQSNDMSSDHRPAASHPHSLR